MGSQRANHSELDKFIKSDANIPAVPCEGLIWLQSVNWVLSVGCECLDDRRHSASGCCRYFCGAFRWLMVMPVQFGSLTAIPGIFRASTGVLPKTDLVALEDFASSAESVGKIAMSK